MIHWGLWRVSRRYRADMVLARIGGTDELMRVIWEREVLGYLAMLIAVGGFMAAYILAVG